MRVMLGSGGGGVQSLSCIRPFATPWSATRQASLSIINFWSLLKLMSIESVMLSKHLILYHPFCCLQYFPVSRSFLMSQLFTSGGQSIGASASASVLPMTIQSWFPLELTDLISLQSNRLLRVFLQHHNSKPSIVWFSAFFMVQLLHPYMTTGKTIALTIQTFVGKVMSLLFNTLSGFVVAFLPRSKRFFISWL